jgi:hypothetical protein
MCRLPRVSESAGPEGKKEERRVRKIMLTAAAGVWLLLPAGVFGSDWIIEEVDPDFPGDRVISSYSEGKVRVEGLLHGLVFLVDLPAGEGFIIDGKAGKYAGGDIDGIARMMLPRREREDGAEAVPGESSRSPAVMPGVRIERVAEEETVAGFAAQRYRVFLEDLLVEELWFAPDINAVTAGGRGSLAAFLDIMTGSGEGEDFPPGYEGQEAYRELSRRGYVVRRVTYFRGEENRIEAVKAERTTHPPGIFKVPEGMEEAPYRKLFLGRD